MLLSSFDVESAVVAEPDVDFTPNFRSKLNQRRLPPTRNKIIELYTESLPHISPLVWLIGLGQGRVTGRMGGRLGVT